ncbi:GntR family transcriptional regulator [Limnohabitans sp.]|uniref:GntR family transcriptional regulator n=1 Tax=Limnohabitans sp. TaxID=1907725 RepID=UPI00286F73FA|nr:GntR family transcriptional regulator [Limnohabitans sp.]
MRPLPSSLHDDVAAQLRIYIFEGQLRPGSFIDEVTLCELWSISRTPLREALKVLTAEGLVRHEPRRGCFVNEVTEQDLDDIFPVIALLEGRCAFDATQRVTPADVQALEALHLRLKEHAQAGRINDYYDTNFAIHEAIIALASNKWLAQTIANLRKILKLARLQQLHAPGRLKQSLKEHLAVFAALKAGDAVGAEEAMRDHLLQQREALRALALAQRRVLTV